MEPKLGSLRVMPASDYGKGLGYGIELFSYWQRDEPHWCVPDWEERSRPELAGVFRSYSKAKAAIEEAA